MATISIDRCTTAVVLYDVHNGTMKKRDNRDDVAAIEASSLVSNLVHLVAGVRPHRIPIMSIHVARRADLAVLLVDGTVVPEPTLAHAENPRVRAPLAKVTLACKPMPRDRARIEIVTQDGHSLCADGSVSWAPSGDPSRLRADGVRFLSEARLTHLERLLGHLEDVKDVGEVLAGTNPGIDEPR